jgi:hypothetical protein
MAQPDQEIRRLLEQRLATMPSVPPIAWENSPFSPPTTGARLWLRARVVYGSQEGLTILGTGDQLVQEGGLFLVDAFGPEGSGPAGVDALATSVRARYPRGMTIIGPTVAVRIVTNSRDRGVQAPEGETGFFIPVSVVWQTSYGVTA